MANNCDFYNYIVISSDPYNKRVVLYKCCVKNQPSEYIMQFPFEIWRKLDAYKECKKYINNFGKNHDRSLLNFCIEKGAEKECFRENNVLSRVCLYLDFSCNAECSFCEAYKDRRNFLRQNSGIQQKLKNIFFETLDDLKGHNIEVEFSGVGEPLVYKKDIKNFIKTLKKEDFKKINIITNGSLIDDDLISIIKASQIPFFFLVSLNVPNEEAYNEIMKLKNFEKTFNNVLKIKKAGIDINTTFTICEDSLKYYNDYLSVFKTLKENNIRIELRPDYRSTDYIINDSRFKQLQEWAK